MNRGRRAANSGGAAANTRDGREISMNGSSLLMTKVWEPGVPLLERDRMFAIRTLIHSSRAFEPGRIVKVQYRAALAAITNGPRVVRERRKTDRTRFA